MAEEEKNNDKQIPQNDSDSNLSIEEEELQFPDDFYQYDEDDMKGMIQGFPNQIREAYKLGSDINFEGEINKVVIAGMGGSAIAGDILKTYLENSQTQIQVSRDYELPKNVDKNTLVVISSYSGNTEETISAYKDALRKFCKIVMITTGGKLSIMAKENRTPIIKIPSGMVPRAALAYGFFPMLKVMENIRVAGNCKKDVEHVAKSLEKEVFRDTGLKLSEKLFEKIPIIYSNRKLWPIAYRWRTQLNENSKVLAIHHSFPELNHNEILGLKNSKAKFHCVILRTDKEVHRISKRMEVTKELYRKSNIDVTEIALKGDTLLTRLFSFIHIGDWTSYYLALKYKTNPAETKAIEDFKKDLGSFIA
jgi:glucose/mannose-6-phosphate isomerase